MSRVNQVVVSETKTLVEVENQVRQTVVDKVVRHAVNVGPRGADGERGPKGDTGATGAGLNVLGSLGDYADLPTTGLNPGDGYIIDGVVWVWDGSAWVEVEWSGPELPRRLHEEAQVAGSDWVRETGWTTEGTPVESTFTRASQAWDGTKLVAPDTMRVFGRDTKSPVVLIEGQRTNLLLHNSDLSADAWTTGASAVAREAAGTHQGMPVTRLTYGGSDSGTPYLLQHIPRALFAGKTITLSFLARNVQREPGGGSFRARLGIPNDEGAVDTTPALTDEFTRVTLTTTFPVGGGGNTYIMLLRNGSPGTDVIEVCGLQVEEAAFPSSYIPTDGAPATRAGEDLALPINVSDSFTVHVGAFGKEVPRLSGLWNITNSGILGNHFTRASISGSTGNILAALYIEGTQIQSTSIAPEPDAPFLLSLAKREDGTATILFNGETVYSNPGWDGAGGYDRAHVGSGLRSGQSYFHPVAPGAAALGIPFIDNRAWSEAEIQAAHARWLPELEKIEVPV